MAFVKLDTAILRSSLWIERDMRSLFVTALVMAEPREFAEPCPQIEVRSLEFTGWVVPPGWYGFVPAAGVGIVHQDGLPTDEGLNQLERLCSPDPESRSQEYDGRRMARINGGYLILNYFKYRDFDHTAADRMRRLRARRKVASVTANNVDVTPNVTEAEDRVQSAELQSSSSSSRETLLSAVPNRAAWEAVLNGALQGLDGPMLTAAQLERAVTDYVGNGEHAKPNLRYFRAYLRDAARPAETPIRHSASGGGARNDAALEAWLAKKESHRG